MSLKKLLDSSFYLVPRLMLYGIFLICFLIIIMASLGYLNPYENPLEMIRAKSMHGIRTLQNADGAVKTK